MATDRLFSVRTDKAGEELAERIFLKLSNDHGRVLKKSAAFKEMLKLIAEQEGIPA